MLRSTRMDLVPHPQFFEDMVLAVDVCLGALLVLLVAAIVSKFQKPQR